MSVKVTFANKAPEEAFQHKQGNIYVLDGCGSPDVYILARAGIGQARLVSIKNGNTWSDDSAYMERDGSVSTLDFLDHCSGETFLPVDIEIIAKYI